jgi:surfactin synthase thioesterase subunit
MTDSRHTTLFCIPYAGGSASAIYGRWSHHLPKTIKVVPLELAGHGRRMQERFYPSMEAAVADLLATIELAAHRPPYAIYAHSMGTIIAYELAKAATSAGLPAPCAMFLSGRNPPHYEYPMRNMHLFDDDLFLAEIKKLGGTPEEFFKMKDLVSAFLPILRNDYRLVELYRFLEPLHVLDSDLIFLHSDCDPLVKKPEIYEWRGYSSGRFAVKEFPGGHFFINDCGEAICRLITNTLQPQLFSTLFHAA